MRIQISLLIVPRKSLAFHSYFYKYFEKGGLLIHSNPPLKSPHFQTIFCIHPCLHLAHQSQPSILHRVVNRKSIQCTLRIWCSLQSILRLITMYPNKHQEVVDMMQNQHKLDNVASGSSEASDKPKKGLTTSEHKVQSRKSKG